MQTEIDLPAPEGTIGDDNELTKAFPMGRQTRQFGFEFLRAAGALQTAVLGKVELAELTLKASTKTVVKNLTGAMIIFLMKYAGYQIGDDIQDADAAYFRIPFVDRHARRIETPEGPLDGESLALGGDGLSSLVATLTLGTMHATTPTVRIIPKVSQTSNNARPGWIRRYLREKESAWSTVEKSLKLPTVDGEIIRRIHITGYGAGVIDYVNVKDHKGDLVQVYRTHNIAAQAAEMGGKPQAGTLSFELGRVGNILDGVVTGDTSNADVAIEWSTVPTGGNFSVIYDTTVNWASLKGG